MVIKFIDMVRIWFVIICVHKNSNNFEKKKNEMFVEKISEIGECKHIRVI